MLAGTLSKISAVNLPICCCSKAYTEAATNEALVAVPCMQSEIVFVESRKHFWQWSGMCRSVVFLIHTCSIESLEALAMQHPETEPMSYAHEQQKLKLSRGRRLTQSCSCARRTRRQPQQMQLHSRQQWHR